MPDTIAPPVSRPATPNTSDTLFLTADTTIAAGTTHYGNGLPHHEFESSAHNGMMLAYLDTAATTLTNNGTMWHFEEGERIGLGDYVIAGLGNVINNGLIVLETDTGSAYAIFAQGHFQNTGDIYALTQNGLAFGYVTEDVYSVVENSGFIGAQSMTGVANTVLLDNGARLVNHVGGEIIAVGDDATAVVFNRSAYHIFSGDETNPTVLNQGLIEARSLDPGKASTAFYISHLAHEKFELVNEGTIRGDYAIFADGSTFSPLQKGPEHITNAAGGVIEGIVYLAEGDDTLINRGTLTGDVLLSDGNDLFDSAGGVFNGVANLGFGEDIFYGGTGGDFARGEVGDDVLEGRGGNDLLIGDWGADTLTGGNGNDGLYGETGADLIKQQGGDVIFGGSGADRIVLNDYQFASINGESGHDTLALAGNGRLLDLAAVITAARVTGIEQIELGAGDGLVVRTGNIAAFAGASAPLYVSARSGAGAVTLVGSWVAGSTTTLEGVTYNSWSLSGETFYAAQGITVNVAASAPGGALGLDAIAGGGAALVAGAVPGMARFSGLTSSNFFNITSDLTIDSDESWFSDAGNGVIHISDISHPDLTNLGKIISVSDAVPEDNNGFIGFVQADLRLKGWFGQDQISDGKGAMAVTSYNAGILNNSGLIYAESSQTGISIASFTGARGQILNSGRIESHAIDGVGIGIVSWNGSIRPLDDWGIDSSGQIIASSETNRAIGIWQHNMSSIRNSGLIDVTSGLAAYGMVLDGGTEIENSGQIRAVNTGSGSEPSAAFHVRFTQGLTVTNSGVIVAGELVVTDGSSYNSPFELHNSGAVEADINLFISADRIDNSGTITGDIDFGGGNDSYRNLGGSVAGTIAGGTGFDTASYTGNRAAYTVTTGPGGSVTVSGAFGTDHFSGVEFLAFADQTLTIATGEVHDEVGERIIWRNDNGALTWWRTPQYPFDAVHSAVVGVAQNWHVAGTGDFNGDFPGVFRADVQDDILWRSTSGHLTFWTSTNTGYVASSYMAQVGTDWQIAGVGDINSDRFADIVWRHSSGAVTAWRGTGSAFDNSGVTIAHAGLDWQIEAVTDFDRNGRADILWRHTSGTTTVWMGQDDHFDGSYWVGTNVAGAGWELAGTGDFDGDGMNDVLWRNTSGALAVWTSVGAGFWDAPGFFNMVDTGWHVAMVGNFDGDSDDDILWRHDNGAVTWWRSTGTGFDANTGFIAGVSTDWNVVTDGELLA